MPPTRNTSPAPTHGLKPTDLQVICDTLARYPAVERGVLFGSRAMGTFSHASDIDLALEGIALDRKILGRIASDLEESRLAYNVDLLHRSSSLAPKVEEHIRKHGQLIYRARAQTPREDHARATQDQHVE